MICYKDKTFCLNWETCMHGKYCHRALTDEVKDGASRADLPISMSAFPIDTCEEWIDENGTRVVERSR